MKAFSLFAILGSLAVAPLFADEKSDADAKAALALAKAKAARPGVKAQTQAISYIDAKRIAKREGKPILVAVGFDCNAVAATLRPDVITCHEITLDGSTAKRVRLEIPAAVPSGWIKLEWQRCPPADEVKAEIIKNSPRTNLTEQWDAAMEQFVVAMTALEGDTPTPGMVWKQVCENGTCRMVQVPAASPAAYQQMPVGGAGNVASPPAVGGNQAGGRFFRARFPRLARVRQGFRRLAGLPAPQVRGQFFQVMQADADADADAAPPESMQVEGAKIVAAATGPQVVGGPRGHRVIKAFLLRHGAPAAQIEDFEVKYGDSPAWVDLLLALLRDGLPLLLEMLEKLLAK